MSAVCLVGADWICRRAEEIGLPLSKKQAIQRVSSMVAPYFTDEERKTYGISQRLWLRDDVEEALQMMAWRPWMRDASERRSA